MLRKPRFHTVLFALPALLIVTAFAVRTNVLKIGSQSDGHFLIPTGQLLSPAGTHIEVNDRPLGMAVSPDHRTLAVATGSKL